MLLLGRRYAHGGLDRARTVFRVSKIQFRSDLWERTPPAGPSYPGRRPSRTEQPHAAHVLLGAAMPKQTPKKKIRRSVRLHLQLHLQLHLRPPQPQLQGLCPGLRTRRCTRRCSRSRWAWATTCSVAAAAWLEEGTREVGSVFVCARVCV